MILYKYYSCDLNTFKSLNASGLWCDYPKEMNDPFECLNHLSNAQHFSNDEINNLIQKLNASNKLRKKFDVDDFRKFMHDDRQDHIKELAFCSLSKEPLDILMWSHYANSHKGIVLGIDIDNPYLERVTYDDKLPQLDIQFYEDYFLNTEKSHERHKKIIKNISVKIKKWEDEKEWRVWHRQGYCEYGISRLKEVYFGLNCDKETRDLVLKLLDNKKDLKSYQIYGIEEGELVKDKIPSDIYKFK